MSFIAESRGESRIGVLQNSLYFKILYSMSNKSDPSGTPTNQNPHGPVCMVAAPFS